MNDLLTEYVNRDCTIIITSYLTKGNKCACYNSKPKQEFSYFKKKTVVKEHVVFEGFNHSFPFCTSWQCLVENALTTDTLTKLHNTINTYGLFSPVNWKHVEKNAISDQSVKYAKKQSSNEWFLNDF